MSKVFGVVTKVAKKVGVLVKGRVKGLVSAGNKGRSEGTFKKMSTGRLQKISGSGNALLVNQINAQLELLYRQGK